METIEQRVARSILEKKQEVEIAGETYQVAPPTTATLIEVSAIVSTLPAVELDPDNILIESLRVAKDCRQIGDIIAVLVLGEGNDTTTTKKVPRKGRKWYQSKFIEVEETGRQALARKALQLSPSKLQTVLTQLLLSMEIGDFFGVTTSLIEVNLTRQTKETKEVGKTTASGQPSLGSPKVTP